MFRTFYFLTKLAQLSLVSSILICSVSSGAAPQSGSPVNSPKTRSENSLAGGARLESKKRLPPIVFVSRKSLSGNKIPGFGPALRSAPVGGSLILRRSSGSIHTLVGSEVADAQARLFDVADPRVSWDAKRIVFSGLTHPDSSWRLFEIGIDGRNFRQITRSDRVIDLSQFGDARNRFASYDDLDPCYMPDGRIVFSSTRFPAIAQLGELPATNLFVVNPDGSRLHRITTERNGADQPTIDPLTGRIVYARWWLNIDRPSNVTRDGISREPEQMVNSDAANIWQAVTVTPDGDDLRLFAADARTRHGSQSYRPVVAHDGSMFSVYSPQTSLLPDGGGYGIRWFARGAGIPHHIAGARQSEAGSWMQQSPPFATDPVPLPDGRVLFSYSIDGSDYGLFVCNRDGSNIAKVFDLVGTSELNADLAIRRPVPPVISGLLDPPKFELPPTEDPETFGRNETFRFDCLNIFSNAGVDLPMGQAPLISQRSSIRFFINPQRQNTRGEDPAILFRTSAVNADGSVHEHDMPADLPMFEQIIDDSGRVMTGSNGSVAHVAGLNFSRAGTGTKCVGCHVGHSLIPVPKNYSDAAWFNAAPSATIRANSVFIIGDSVTFGPEYLADRKVKLSKWSENWVAPMETMPSVLLSWIVPIEVRELVLYNIGDVPELGGAIQVRDCGITLYRGNEIVQVIRHNSLLRRGGTSIRISPPQKIDSLKFIINRTTGGKKQAPYTGLAEIEVIARLVP